MNPVFVEESKWPISKEPGEITVNPSHDKQLQDHLVEQLLVAMKQKHPAKVKEALVSLIQCIQLEEE